MLDTVGNVLRPLGYAEVCVYVCVRSMSGRTQKKPSVCSHLCRQELRAWGTEVKDFLFGSVLLLFFNHAYVLLLGWVEDGWLDGWMDRRMGGGREKKSRENYGCYQKSEQKATCSDI